MYNDNLLTFNQLFTIDSSLLSILLIVRYVVNLTTILNYSEESSIISIYNKIKYFGSMSYVIHVNIK